MEDDPDTEVSMARNNFRLLHTRFISYAVIFLLTLLISFIGWWHTVPAMAAVFEPQQQGVWGVSPPLQRPLTLPSGTRLWVMLKHPVVSGHARPGDAVEALLLQPVILNGMLLAPMGSLIAGHVEATDGTVNRSHPAYVQFRFTRLEPQASLPAVSISAVVDTADNTHGRLFADTFLKQLHPVAYQSHQRRGKHQHHHGLSLGALYLQLRKTEDVQLNEAALDSLQVEDDPYHALGLRWHIGQGYLVQGRELRLPAATPLPIVLEKPLTFSGEYLPKPHIPVNTTPPATKVRI
jgi:hypothetical protein